MSLAACELVPPPPAVLARPASAGARPVSISACESGRWSLYLLHKQTLQRFAVRYRCNSWRHEGDCARHNSHRIYSRLKAPIDRVDPKHVLCAVLTLDPDEVRRCAAETAPGVDARYVAFRSLWRRWQSFRQALHRLADRLGERRARWALTVEAHKRSGWPHAHLLIEWPWLARELAADDDRHDCLRRPKRRNGLPGHQATVCGAPGCLRDWLSARAEACGLGRVVDFQIARSPEQAASYLVKLAGETGKGVAGAAQGELLKLSQVPIHAPRHFRRLRYSLRAPKRELEAMLDPVRRDPNITGALCTNAVEALERVIVEDRDLVDRVDVDTGEVTRVPFVLARAGPPPPDWLERFVLPHLEAAFQRLHMPPTV